MITTTAMPDACGINEGMEEHDHTDADQKRGRIIFDAEDAEVLGAAIQLRASKMSVAYRRKVSKSEALASIVREALAEELRELQEPANDTRKHKKPKHPHKP